MTCERRLTKKKKLLLDSRALEMCLLRCSSKDDVVHWEQFGRLDANLEIDGKPIEIRRAMTVRDRSFGNILYHFGTCISEMTWVSPIHFPKSIGTKT